MVAHTYLAFLHDESVHVQVCHRLAGTIATCNLSSPHELARQTADTVDSQPPRVTYCWSEPSDDDLDSDSETRRAVKGQQLSWQDLARRAVALADLAVHTMLTVAVADIECAVLTPTTRAALHILLVDCRHTSGTCSLQVCAT